MKNIIKRIMNSLPVVLFLLPVVGFTQQNNWWHFGNGCSIDFNSGNAVVGTSAITHMEGTSSISNASGQPLFYTNGIKAYRANGQPMPDLAGSTTYAMSGHNSTTQTIIVPKPGTTQYYIFTVGFQNTDKMKYSVVDMAINSGTLISINSAMPDPTGTALNDCEKVAAVKMCNGTGFWVINHEYGSNKYRAFPVTSAGIGNPVISSVGMIPVTDPNKAIGQLKFSANGKLIAAATKQYGIEVFDFNPSSGVLSLKKTISQADISLCGVEFSPNGQYIYYGSLGGVYRYDITTPNSPPVLISTYATIHSFLQIAPDGNIYMTAASNCLAKITNPNTGGAFVLCGLPLAAGTTASAGLPSFTNFNTPFCSTASFVFTNEGQMERSVNTLYGPQIITEVCLPNIYIDGSASSNENSYFLEIRLMTNLMTWANTVVYSQWINTSGPVPPSLIDISQYYSGFIPGSDYLVTLSVGPEWSSMSRLLRPKNCPPSACFVFSDNIQQTTANENSPYGPQQVTSVCMPTVKIDGSCTMNETGYHIQVDPFNIVGWTFIPPNFYNNWVSTTQDAGAVNLTTLVGLNGHSFQPGNAYRVALSVGTTPQNWNTMAKFFRVKDCRGSVQFEEITPEEIAAAQAGESAILIFPNPGSGLFNVSNVNGTLGQITVCDVVGKTILNQAAAGTSSVQIDLSAYPPGVYFARIQAGDKIVTRRMIKN